MADVDSSGGWSLDLAEDIDLPGWVWLPEDMDADQRRDWLDEVTPMVLELVSAPEGVGEPVSEAEIRGLIESGLDSRADAESYAMYMVWPVRAPAAVMCHVNLARIEDLPAWGDIQGRMHGVEARNLGPGVQITTEVTVDSDDGPEELVTVVYVFADDEASILVNLEPSLPQLVGPAMVGVGMFVNAVAVSRPDGSAFRAQPSTAPIITGDEWPSDEEGVS